MASELKARLKKAYQEAIDLQRRGDLAAAEETARRELDRMPATTERGALKYRARLRFLLGEIERSRGNAGAAVDCYERALASDPELEVASMRLVELQIDSPEALNHDMAPHYIRYLARGGDKRLKYGALRRLQHILRIRLTERPAEVVWRMEMLLKLHAVRPDINFPKLYLGRAHYLLREYQDAIEYFDALAGSPAETASVLNVVGRCHEKLGNLGAARAAYEKSLRINGDQAGILFRLGRIELKQAEIAIA